MSSVSAQIPSGLTLDQLRALYKSANALYQQSWKNEDRARLKLLKAERRFLVEPLNVVAQGTYVHMRRKHQNDADTTAATLAIREQVYVALLKAEASE